MTTPNTERALDDMDRARNTAQADPPLVAAQRLYHSFQQHEPAEAWIARIVAALREARIAGTCDGLELAAALCRRRGLTYGVKSSIWGAHITTAGYIDLLKNEVK